MSKTTKTVLIVLAIVIPIFIIIAVGTLLIGIAIGNSFSNNNDTQQNKENNTSMTVSSNAKKINYYGEKQIKVNGEKCSVGYVIDKLSSKTDNYNNVTEIQNITFYFNDIEFASYKNVERLFFADDSDRGVDINTETFYGKNCDGKEEQYVAVRYNIDEYAWEYVYIFNSKGKIIGSLIGTNIAGISVNANPKPMCQINSDSISLINRIELKGKDGIEKNGVKYSGVKYKITVENDVLRYVVEDIYLSSEVTLVGK